jgi:porin
MISFHIDPRKQISRMNCDAMRTVIAALGLPASVFADQLHEAPASVLNLEAAYTGERWQNLRGGVERGGTYLDNLDLVAILDGERAFGAAGTTVSLAALYNNRTTFSDLVRDLQTVSSIDTDGSLRLYEAWVERVFAAAAVKAGLMDLNAEFDVNEIGSLFINSSHGIGPELSQVGENGPSIFPITGLGVRMQFDLPGRSQLRLGVFEGTPGDPDRPRRTAIELQDGEGMLLIGEITYRAGTAGRIAFGSWQHARRLPMIAAPEQMKRHHIGAYALIEGNVASTDNHAFSGFARIGVADEDVFQISRYYGAGLVVSGPLLWSARHEEQLGIAIGVVSNGRSHLRMQQSAGATLERRETAVELTYRIQLTPQLALHPDIQYIVNPGTDPALRNALAAGVRFTWHLDREAPVFRQRIPTDVSDIGPEG